MTQSPNAAPLDDLLALMRRLRDPQTGCPWDLAQNFATIAPYTLEEAYEVADAIQQNDLAALKDELGDLLFQVVFHAQMADEQGAFDFQDVARAITVKMRRRHPHVFGTAHIADAADQSRAWEEHKAQERAAKGETRASVLDGIPLALPALTRAAKLHKRMAREGFDWPDAQSVLQKLEEEIAELRAELAKPTPPRDRIEDELGDILSVCTNLARFLDVDPESALRRGNAKIERRFRFIERALAARGTSLAQATLAEMERHWAEAKAAERLSPAT